MFYEKNHQRPKRVDYMYKHARYSLGELLCCYLDSWDILNCLGFKVLTKVLYQWECDVKMMRLLGVLRIGGRHYLLEMKLRKI